ncbi:MAG: DUF5615 family PIN-like protein [bacterium]
MTPRQLKFKFYLDENFPVPTGKFLKSLGHNVLFGIKVLRKSGLSDFKHIAESTKQNAILLAFDRDFVINNDLVARASKSPGVILIIATDTKSSTAEMILRKIIKNLTCNGIKGKICCASIDKIEYKKAE